MRRKIAAGIVLAMAVLVFGCADTKEKPEQGQNQEQKQEAAELSHTVTLKKDGSVIGTIEGDFEKEYYGEDTLKEFTLGAVSEYNQAGGDRIKVKKLQAEDGAVKVVLQYASAEDYQAFNSAFNTKTFFAGTVAEAYEKGYNLDVVLVNVNDGTEQIGKDELLEMGSRRLVIVQEALEIETFGKILYASGQVEIKGKKTAVTPDGELSYVLFK